MRSAAPRDVCLPVEPLVAFAWRFTFAAVPKPLRVELVTAVHDALTRVATEMEGLREHIARGETPPGGSALPNGLFAAVALLEILEIDDAFVAWRRTHEGAALQLPHPPVDPTMITGAISEAGCARMGDD